MLSSKKSPRRSDLFRSRIMAAGQDAATIRNVRRIQEFLAGQVVLAILQAGFLVAFALFARAVYNIFERHGNELNPQYLRLSLGGILVCFLLIARRLVLRARAIIGLRSDLSQAQAELRELRESLRRLE